MLEGYAKRSGDVKSQIIFYGFRVPQLLSNLASFL